MSQNAKLPSLSSRRDFLKTTGAASAGALAAGLIGRTAHAAGGDLLRVGVVGCGGRGSGAAANALHADPNCKIAALADAFPDRLQLCLQGLKKASPDRVMVDDAHCFTGLDCCEKLLASDVEVVILAEPPHFRPRHLKAAIEAGKHVFCEKPVAVDGPGVRSVLETAELAKQKKLNLVSGLCWRYHYGVRETMKRILDGAIGDILTIQATYNTGKLWERPRKPDWTEMQFQVRNWYYFTWLSGDHNVEQHIHTLDKSLWLMGDTPPEQAWGLGGRQVRVEPQFGNIFDHHAVVYQYPSKGTTVYSYCRQMPGCWSDTSAIIVGTKGRANVLKHQIFGEKPWKYDGPDCNMYDVEHEALFGAIRAGQTINNGRYMAYSTMMAIMGRMTTYTGELVTWEKALQSKEDLSPSAYTWDATPPIMPGKDGYYPVAIPGVSKVV